MTEVREKWFTGFRLLPSARLRLICFPYAGGSAQVFSSWVSHLPSDVDLCAVNLPGRAQRFSETPIGSMSDLIPQIVEALIPITDRPFALFGHSMGGKISVAAADAFAARGRVPAHIFISGCPAPHLRSATSWHQLPDRDFLRAVGHLNGARLEGGANTELLELMLPTLRADFRLAETWSRVADDRKLNCPITVFGGAEDPIVDPGTLDDWGVHTEAACCSRVFPGDHFFIHMHEAELLAHVASAVSGGARV